MLLVLLLLRWILTPSQTTWALPAPQSKLWWHCQGRETLYPGVQETLKDEESPNFCPWSETLVLTSHQAILQQYGSPLSPFSPCAVHSKLGTKGGPLKQRSSTAS